MAQNKGEESGKAKLKEWQILVIRQKKKSGSSYGMLALKFGVSRACIQKIVNGSTWTHV